MYMLLSDNISWSVTFFFGPVLIMTTNTTLTFLSTKHKLIIRIGLDVSFININLIFLNIRAIVIDRASLQR